MKSQWLIAVMRVKALYTDSTLLSVSAQKTIVSIIESLSFLQRYHKARKAVGKTREDVTFHVDTSFSEGFSVS